MASSAELYDLFLREIGALDDFWAERSRDGQLRLGPEDPDTRRLIEAMAFFAARTRAAASEAMEAAMVRMAGETLDDLLAPMPAAALVEAAPAGRLHADVTIARGSLLRLQFVDPTITADTRAPRRSFGPTQPPGERIALFSTLDTVVVRPLIIESAAVVGSRRALQIEVRLRASVPQARAFDLDLHVRRLADYRASLALHLALEQHTTRVIARSSDGAEMPCHVRFGPPVPGSPIDDSDSRSPLTRIRSFFHFPEQDLTIRVSIPAQAKPWERLTLRFELDERWPEEQGVSTESFRLFVVPAVNLWSDFAAPIVYDGTKDTVPIVSATATREAAELVSLRGVYQADREMAPLLPFSLAQERDGYELLRRAEGGAALLRVRLSDAFGEPRKLFADVVWSQPSLWSTSPTDVRVLPQLKVLNGVDLRLLGAVRRPQQSPLASDPSRCLDVMSLKMRPVLDRRSVAGLLSLLGACGDSPYRGFPDRIDALTVRDAADPSRRAGGIKHVYDVHIRSGSSADAPLVVRFQEQLAALLDAWTQDAVEVRMAPSGVGGASP
ncbi:type VI secretion system baseplate subunit TssF [Polyangium aurulentum]|uniref:type VI secretion system baseplate subunit TssF n=1 Tax=Polyangium aurulentum TaxID=2567896 RepID=UPI00146F265A|nr:type VI secretion system baseplate subunit TssF [Polyangium aurulentum]UQA56292.1 type VI secretion system baseplate subunit TssF [Polyangium aurulentum]